MAYYEVGGSTIELTYPMEGAKRLSNAEGKRRMQQEAVQKLQGLLKKDSTVYTMVRSVSASGMSRQISLFIIQGGRLLSLDFYVSKALGLQYKTGVVIRGCGMDMGFALVYNLARTLFTSKKEDSGYFLNQTWI